ncbi:MAG: M2 family metallopeptidase [Planctomycetes bacterium]|nr:M2 family metallopeptidase [Planctomycetota bacterium]
MNVFACCAAVLAFAFPAALAQETLEQRAARIHREAIVIDGHADTTPKFEDELYDFFGANPGDHVDFPRVQQGGLDAQFWSIYMGAVPGDGKAIKDSLKRIDAVRELVRRHPDRLGLAETAEDIRRLHREGRFACLMGMEGGHMIENELAALRSYHALGVRYLTLTHSFHTDWADSAGVFTPVEPRHGGLNDFGREVVREMNRLGMLVDISHVAKSTFLDALEISRSPVICSHSSTRSLRDHHRNLDDEQLRALATNGGVVMVNFFPGFIDPRWDAAQREKPADPAQRYRTPFSVVIDHLEHVIRVAGEDHVGLGSDYDGITDVPQGLDDVSMLPRITLELLRRGHSEQTVKKLLGGNLLRALERCEQVSRDLAAELPERARAQEFLDAATRKLAELETAASEAQWKASTDIRPEHEQAQVEAEKALAAYLGGAPLLRATQKHLAQREALAPLQLRQLERLRYRAAARPAGTLPEVVQELLQAEAAQSGKLYSFPYRLDDQEVGVQALDDVLRSSRDLEQRRAAWESSKAVGRELKPGLLRLRDLRNRVARAMGYTSWFDYEVREYGMSPQEMLALCDGLIAETRPLYVELHTLARHELAARYGVPVPDLIPAHWLANRWGQDWPGLVEAVELDPLFATRSKEWIVERAEAFYVSLGFPKLPTSFWKLSDLYPPAPGEARAKNTHASAWHIDLQRDVRALMSVVPDAHWFGTTHHELGHIYYYLAYARAEVPYLLREGADRSFHEGIGELISLAAFQQPYLRSVGVLGENQVIDATAWLLHQALAEASIVFLPFSAGVMTRFEYELYEEELPPERWNRRWWELVRSYQGIAPPSERGEEFCDAATKTHLNDDAAQYYDYALATALKFQLHSAICERVLRCELHAANYAGQRAVGDFLRELLTPGATVDAPELLQRLTGSKLEARAMRAYFAPLEAHLRERNAGRAHTLR